VRILLVLLVISRAPYADDDPWEAGIPVEQQQRANAVFAEANQLFAQQA